MTLDVKALREVAEKARDAYARATGLRAAPGDVSEALAAHRALRDLLSPAAVLALLDRLERAEAKLLETASTCDDLERGYLDDDMSAGDLAREMRAISDDLRGVAALDDEAPR